MLNTKNMTQIVGYIGRDAEMRTVPGGSKVSDFSVAVTEKWVKDGEKMEQTTWFKVVMWNKQAESMTRWMTKGKLVMVNGKVKASAYINKDGEAVATLEITDPVINFMGGNNNQVDDEDEPEQKPQPAPAPKAQAPAPKQQSKPAAAPKKGEAPWDMPNGAGELTF